MNAVNDSLQAAFVLHARPFSDSSLLVELFSLGDGRQPAIAKGARKPGRGSLQSLQPFTPLWVAWRGRGEVATLTKAEPREIPFRLDGKHLYCGIYVNELLMRLIPRAEPLEGLFNLYEQTILALQNKEEMVPLLRLFEMSLLAELGYGMLLTHTSEGEEINPSSWYEYAPADGPRPVEDRNSESSVLGATLLAMAVGDFSAPETRRQSRGLMRRTLDYHLDYKELKSRGLFVRQPWDSLSGEKE